MQQITPVASIVERAKGNLEREKADDAPHVRVSTNKRKKRSQSSHFFKGKASIKQHASKGTDRKRRAPIQMLQTKDNRNRQKFIKKRKINDIWSKN